MFYAQIKDGMVERYPVTPGLMRWMFPNVSFPAQMTDAAMAEYKVYPVRFIPMPDINPLTQSVAEGLPVHTADGWVQNWVVSELPPADAEIARMNALDALRVERNSRLTACDWTQMADAPLSLDEKTAWVKYRQALRDLPENTEDPRNPAWPVAPGGH